MKKIKYYYIRLKRRLIVWWNHDYSYFDFRIYKRKSRLNNIRKRKSIYDLTDMD